MIDLLLQAAAWLAVAVGVLLMLVGFVTAIAIGVRA